MGESGRRTAVVTGSTRGIGRAIGTRLVREGFNVVLNYASDDGAADAALSACSAMTPHVMLKKADVSKRADVEDLMTAAADKFGSLDVLVNNAARVADGPALTMTDDEWERVIDTNLRGTFLCSQIAARHMIHQVDGGVILNIGAATGLRARKNGINTCASKAGIMIMTQCLALELAPKVRVNSIIPGLTMTDEVVQRFNLTDPEVRQARLDAIPLKRIGAPEDVADAVMLLLSPEAQFVTGQKLHIDGGQYMF